MSAATQDAGGHLAVATSAREMLHDVRASRLRRSRTVTGALAGAALLAFAAALFFGEEAVAPADVVAALAGQREGSVRFIVVELRLPRALTGLLAGAAFGLSGALLQLLARNPLASPDLLGISAGASAAAVFSLLVLGWGGVPVSLAALGGALFAAVLIYLLARRGGLTGYRLILVGIGIAALGNAVIGYLLTRSEVRDAQYAMTWLVGSLNGRVWSHAVPLFLSALIVFGLAVVLHRPVRALSLGDEIAVGLGVAVERARLALLLVSVLAAAIATAATGPVAFVALVSAPIARRLLPGGSTGLVASMLVGATAVVVADIAAQHLVPGANLPAGVVTGAIGAPYLLWLLARNNRIRR